MAVLPVPVLRPEGYEDMANVPDYWPGDPLPLQIFDERHRSYVYNRERERYEIYVAPPPPMGVGEFVGAAIAGTVYAVFLLGACAIALFFLWWLIIPVGIIALIIKLLKR